MHARQITPWDDEPDYPAMWAERVDGWLADPDNTEDLLDRLAEDAQGAAAFRRLITVVDDEINWRFAADDEMGEYAPVIRDAIAQIRIMAQRAAELSYEPICDDIDYEDRLHADRLEQMRKYGEVAD